MGKILIAEDIKLISLHLKKILQKLNQNVLSIVESPDEAFKILSNDDNIDILFLSDSLTSNNSIPDSLELTKKIMDNQPHLKIVIITSQGKKQTVLKFINNGAKIYIEKPLHINKIQNILTELTT